MTRFQKALRSLAAADCLVFGYLVLLNVAVGGNWPGYPDETTEFPQTMLVDYVRVYKLAE